MKKPKVVSTTKTVSPTKEDDIYGPDDPAEEAFTKSDCHAFDNIELEPYTGERAIAADAMQLHYGTIDDAGIAWFRKHRVYPGAVRDVANVLWLCSLKDDAEIDRAERDPYSARRKATAWAEEHKITNVRSDGFWKAYAVFMKIMSEVDASVSVPESSGNGTTKSPNE